MKFTPTSLVYTSLVIAASSPALAAPLNSGNSAADAPPTSNAEQELLSPRAGDELSLSKGKHHHHQLPLPLRMRRRSGTPSYNEEEDQRASSAEKEWEQKWDSQHPDQASAKDQGQGQTGKNPAAKQGKKKGKGRGGHPKKPQTSDAPSSQPSENPASPPMAQPQDAASPPAGANDVPGVAAPGMVKRQLSAARTLNYPNEAVSNLPVVGATAGNALPPTLQKPGTAIQDLALDPSSTQLTDGSGLPVNANSLLATAQGAGAGLPNMLSAIDLNGIPVVGSTVAGLPVVGPTVGGLVNGNGPLGGVVSGVTGALGPVVQGVTGAVGPVVQGLAGSGLAGTLKGLPLLNNNQLNSPAQGNLLNSLPVVNNLPVASNLLNNLPVAGNLLNNLPPAGNLLNNLPVAGNLLDNLPVAGNLLNNLPPAGNLLNNLPAAGSLLNNLPTGNTIPLVGGLLQNNPSAGNIPVAGSLLSNAPAAVNGVYQIPASAAQRARQALAGVPSQGPPSTAANEPTEMSGQPSTLGALSEPVGLASDWIMSTPGNNGVDGINAQAQSDGYANPLSFASPPMPGYPSGQVPNVEQPPPVVTYYPSNQVSPGGLIPPQSAQAYGREQNQDPQAPKSAYQPYQVYGSSSGQGQQPSWPGQGQGQLPVSGMGASAGMGWGMGVGTGQGGGAQQGWYPNPLGGSQQPPQQQQSNQPSVGQQSGLPPQAPAYGNGAQGFQVPQGLPQLPSQVYQNPAAQAVGGVLPNRLPPLSVGAPIGSSSSSYSQNPSSDDDTSTAGDNPATDSQAQSDGSDNGASDQLSGNYQNNPLGYLEPPLKDPSLSIPTIPVSLPVGIPSLSGGLGKIGTVITGVASGQTVSSLQQGLPQGLPQQNRFNGQGSQFGRPYIKAAADDDGADGPDADQLPDPTDSSSADASAVDQDSPTDPSDATDSSADAESAPAASSSDSGNGDMPLIPTDATDAAPADAPKPPGPVAVAGQRASKNGGAVSTVASAATEWGLSIVLGSSTSLIPTPTTNTVPAAATDNLPRMKVVAPSGTGVVNGATAVADWGVSILAQSYSSVLPAPWPSASMSSAPLASASMDDGMDMEMATQPVDFRAEANSEPTAAPTSTQGTDPAFSSVPTPQPSLDASMGKSDQADSTGGSMKFRREVRRMRMV